VSQQLQVDSPPKFDQRKKPGPKKKKQQTTIDISSLSERRAQMIVEAVQHESSDPPPQQESAEGGFQSPQKKPGRPRKSKARKYQQRTKNVEPSFAWNPIPGETWYKITYSRYGKQLPSVTYETDPFGYDHGFNPLLERQTYHPKHNGWLTQEEYEEFLKVNSNDNSIYSIGTRM
jgi:hypothetical protein